MSEIPRPRRRARRLLCLLLLCMGVLLTAGWVAQPFLKERDLARALEGVTRLRVRTGGACHRRLPEERTLFETADPEEIRQLASAVRFSPHLFDLGCQCCGLPTLEFYRADSLVLALSLHHGKAVRRIDGPWENAPLTNESGAAMKRWLARHGISEASPKAYR